MTTCVCLRRLILRAASSASQLEVLFGFQLRSCHPTNFTSTYSRQVPDLSVLQRHRCVVSGIL